MSQSILEKVIEAISNVEITDDEASDLQNFAIAAIGALRDIKPHTFFETAIDEFIFNYYIDKIGKNIVIGKE